MNNDQYFAALTGTELVSELAKKVTDFAKVRKPWEERWKRNFRAFYGIDANTAGLANRSGKLSRSGMKGEMVDVNVNQFANIVQHLENLIIGVKPSFQAQATNNEQKSINQTKIANNVLEYYLTEKNLIDRFKRALKHALLMDAGYVMTEWDTSKGPDLGVQGTDPHTNPETGEVTPGDATIVKEGDLVYSNPTPYDVVFDLSKEDFNENEWVIVRCQKNKWDLAAQYPDDQELQTKIIETKARTELTRNEFNIWNTSKAPNEDDIDVFKFYHISNNVIPGGKFVMFCGSDVVLYEGEIQYDKLPIDQITAGVDISSQFGFSPANQLTPIQELLNMLYSTLATCYETFGVQKVAIPREANVNLRALQSNLAAVLYDGNQVPSALQLTEPPERIQQVIEMLEHAMETISGVNSVVRGNPEASLQSGSALALVQSQSLAFASPLQDSYASMVSNVGTSTIKLLRNFAESKRVIAITGIHQASMMTDFKGSDLDSIDRVSVDLGNPLARTMAGKLQLLQTYQQMGLFKDPRQVAQFLDSGRLELVYERPSSQTSMVRKENEDLMEGRGARAVLTDDHQLHMIEHSVLLDDPAIRQDPELVEMIESHIWNEHYTYFLANPNQAAMLTAMGQTPLAPDPIWNTLQPGSTPPSKIPGMDAPMMPAQPTAPQQGSQGGSAMMAPGLNPGSPAGLTTGRAGVAGQHVLNTQQQMGAGQPAQPNMPKPAQSPIQNDPRLN